MTSLERIKFMGGDYYYTIARPINYFKVLHLCTYAIFIFLFIKKYSKNWPVKRKNYAWVILAIYFVTAVLQACFTAAILLSEYFIIYYVFTFSIVLIIGYVLYFQPEIFQKLKVKYSNSTLTKSDKNRILDKIEAYLSDKDKLVDTRLNLNLLAQNIEEKKHHISQALSQELETSFNGYVNKKRIEYSKKLLRNPAYDKFKIAAIAIDSGFSNKNTFNRAFVKYTSLTPSEFRKNNSLNVLTSKDNK